MCCVSFQSTVHYKTNWLSSAVWGLSFVVTPKVLSQGSLEENEYIFQRGLHRSAYRYRLGSIYTAMTACTVDFLRPNSTSATTLLH